MKKILFWLAAILTLQGCVSSSPMTHLHAPIKPASVSASSVNTIYADAHFHSSNYAYQGIALKTFIDQYMGNKVVRSVLMPIPLQQKWEAYEHYAHDKMAPNYYIGSKGELYYYAFADAMIAREYEKLSPQDQLRLDPMITGFNPMDNYAVDHIKRVLLTFPSVFSGIGEFTIHKEVVSHKVAGQALRTISKEPLPVDVRENDTLTLHNPSLTKILDLAAETGLVVTIHNDIYEADVEWNGTLKKEFSNKPYVQDLITLCKKSPKTKVIWAHTGLGRYVKPTADHLLRVANVLDACSNWSVDISWDLVQKVIIQPEAGMPALQEWAKFLNQYQDRVLWGSDTVMHSSNDTEKGIEKGVLISVTDYQAVLAITQPLWQVVSPTVAYKIKFLNYQTLFDHAKKQVRLWEKQHHNDNVWDLKNSL